MINLAQHRSALHRGLGLVTLLIVLLVVGGCNNQQPAAIPTPDLEILAPTATGVTARVEVVVVVVTATSEPTEDEPTAEPTAPPEPTAGATEASSNESAASPTAASGNTTAAPTATPGTGDTGEQQTADSSGQPQTADGSGQTPEMSNQQLINRGEEVYSENCASCHQPNGEGTDLYPALNQSALLESGDPTQAIQIVLYGRGEMPAFEDTLSNQQIASVLSYERNAWQNDSSVVRVAQVRQVRQGGSADTAQGDETAATQTEATAPADSAEAPTTEPAATESTATEPAATETAVTTPTPAVEATEATAEDTAAPAEESATVTAAMTTTEATAVVAETPTPAPSGTVSTTVEAPTVSLTWTPAREVTPLLPTTELTTTTSDDGSATAAGTPTPPTTVTVTVSATGTVTVTVTGTASMTETNNVTPSATEATATPAESPTAAESADGSGESASGMSDEELISMGETVYATECASCHQINGEGNSTYPALNGSEMLTADDPTAAISIVLNGQGEMPAFNEILSTEEIAAVLSHERTAWDNSASVVTVTQVEEVRGN